MQNNPVYRKNISLLQLNHPQIYTSIRGLGSGKDNCNKITSETGLPTLEIQSNHNKIHLHSKRDPLKEAKRIAESFIDGSEQIIVVVGLGLGYHIDAMLKANQESLFIVKEPDPELFAVLLRTRDLSNILLSKRVILSVGTAPLNWDEIFPNPSVSTSKLFIHRPYAHLYSEIVKKIEQDFHAFRNRTQINIATLKRFDQLWTKNTFKNCTYFFTLHGIYTLKDALKDFAAVVIGAGPSLENDMEIIAGLKEKMVLIASDTVLAPLLKRNIIPDFVITVDPQFINSFSITGAVKGIKKEKLPVLVADPAVYPATLKNYRGIKVITSSVFSPGKIIETFSGIKGSIAAGGSVVTTAFDFARITGADPIILTGLDLSYGIGRTHLSGSFIEEYILSRTNRFETAGCYYSRYIRGGSPAWVIDKNGHSVVSDSRLLLYKSWFEHQSKSEGKNIFNATSGGLDIAGISNILPEKVVEHLPHVKKNKKTVMEKIRAHLESCEVHTEQIAAFTNYLSMVRENLTALQKISARGMRAVQQQLNKTHTTHTGLEKKLHSIDEKILSFKEESHLISMVMQSPIDDILSGRGGRSKAHAYISTLKLYSSIHEAAEMLLDLMALAKRKLSKNYNNFVTAQ